MEAPARIPPIIETTPRRSFTPVYVFAFVALAMLASALSGFFDFGFPKCSFKTITGIPCASCGGTRSLRALGHLDFAGAFWWNPLVMFAAIGAAVWFVLWTITPQRKMDEWIVALKRFPWLFVGLALVALNWIFVMKFLPR